MNNNKENYTWLTSLFMGWGLKEAWAKLLAGAVIGALCAVGFLTSCSEVTPSQIYSAHELYHSITDKPCIFVDESK